MDPVAAITLAATAIAAVIGAYLGLRRAPLDRDGVYISTAEGATRILNSAMLSLEKDLERKGVVIEQLMTDSEAKTAALRRKDEAIAKHVARIEELEKALGHR